jgi:hypothetical protein
MVIQLKEEVPAVCQNKKCYNFNSFELVDVDDIKKDKKKESMLYVHTVKIKYL